MFLLQHNDHQFLYIALKSLPQVATSKANMTAVYSESQTGNKENWDQTTLESAPASNCEISNNLYLIWVFV